MNSGPCMKEVPDGEPQTKCGEGRIERDNETVHGEPLYDSRCDEETETETFLWIEGK